MPTYELIIIGAGPAGCAAAVYAARKQIKTAIIADSFGGQSGVSAEIYNWIGTKAISGYDLDKALEAHVKEYEGPYLDIISGSLVTGLAQVDEGVYEVKVGDESYTTVTVLVASGSSRRKLNISGAEKFENKGVVYCATCDGPLFSGQDVVVVGGGNAGFETAAQLSAYCKSVTILHRSESFKADQITVDKVLEKDNVSALTNCEPIEIKGEQFVSGVVYQNKLTGEEVNLDATGIFVEIGQIPNTQFLSAGLVELDEYNRIKIDPWTQRATSPGVWAAGDVSNIRYHQNNIAAGDAVKAVEDIYLYIHTGV